MGRAHGLDGSFVVTLPMTSALEHGAEVVIAGRARRIERRAGTDDRPILRVSGCASRGDADALRGEPLWITRDAVPPLGEDEYWAHDLVGCDVVDGERPVGVVARFLPLPSCEVLEVERTGGAEQLLVPLVKDAVRAVNLDARRIDVDLGFLGEA